jgi:glyoxylase-like metal-dependent hydrolase (beta-lactamase superfamily II)
MDAGMEANGLAIFDFIRAQRRRSEPILGVFLTHWHADHSAGAQALAKLLDCPVYCSQAELSKISHVERQRWPSRLIPSIGPLILMRGIIDDRLYPPVEKATTLEDGETVTGITAIATPGHTFGHHSYYISEMDVLFSGDALAVVRGKLAYMARRVTPDLAAARLSMKKLSSMAPSYVCVGHRFPKQTKRAEWECFARHLDSGRWPTFGLL